MASPSTPSSPSHTASIFQDLPTRWGCVQLTSLQNTTRGCSQPLKSRWCSLPFFSPSLCYSCCSCIYQMPVLLLKEVVRVRVSLRGSSAQLQSVCYAVTSPVGLEGGYSCRKQAWLDAWPQALGRNPAITLAQQLPPF